MPGPTSKLSRYLAHVKEQLKTGKTRGTNPRDLSPEEITALEQKRDALQTTMKIQARERVIARVNSHATAEANRVIQTIQDSIQDSTIESKEFFKSVGGSGSSTELRVQGKVLMTRATEKAKEERAEARAKAKAQKDQERADARAAAKKSPKRKRQNSEAPAEAEQKELAAAAGEEEVVEMDRDEAAQLEEEEPKDDEQKTAKDTTPQQIVDTYLDNKAKRDVEAIIAEVEQNQRIDTDVTRIMNEIDSRKKIRKLFNIN